MRTEHKARSTMQTRAEDSKNNKEKSNRKKYARGSVRERQ